MRKTLFGLTLTAWMGIACAATPKQIVLRVENMTCPACSITIGKTLNKVNGVTAQRVDARAAIKGFMGIGQPDGRLAGRLDPIRSSPGANSFRSKQQR